MMDSRQYAILGALLFFLPTVFTALLGGDYECKPKSWIYGSKATIVFRLDKNTFDKQCTDGTNGLPVFQSSPDGKRTYIQNCTVTTDIRTDCSFPADALGCGCVKSNDNGFYLIEYNFIAAPDYDRWWRADISCISEDFEQILDFSGTNCKNITGVFAQGPGGGYVCKPNPWIYGQKVTIEFRLDRSKYDTRCIGGTSGQPVFRSSPDGQTVNYKPNCTVTTDIRTDCSFPTGALGCGCVNSNDNGFYLIEYNFIAAPDYNRWWRADITCIDSNHHQVLTFSGTKCSDITAVPFCPKGFYGASCSLTCDVDCVDNICARDTGFCTKDNDPNEAFIAVGVGAPALLAILLACCHWRKRILACLGLAGEIKVDKDKERSSGRKEAQETGQREGPANALTGSLVSAGFGADQGEISIETSSKASETSLSRTSDSKW